ncbi:Fc receptor-like protein 2 [Mustelus asterias]
MDLPLAFLLLLEMVFPMTAQEQTVPPILSMEPPWDRFLTGDKIILKCDAGKILRSRSYMWKINNQNDRVGKETYIIEAANKSDNGLYKCKTTSGSPNLSTSYSNVIHVNISELVSFVNIEAVPRIVWADQRLLLRCNYSFPIGKGLIYTFYRERSIVTETTVLNETATLELRNVTLEDKGRYRCEVRYVGYPNGPVFSSNYTHVVIKETPVRITVDPEVPEDGDNITLRCLCTDDLACGSRQYSFYRNNTLVNSDSVSHNEYRIQNATVMDSGWYHCAILSSSLTHTAKSVQITVKMPVGCPDVASDWSIPTLAIGDRVTLTCKSQRGTPPIDYMFYRDRQIIANQTAIDSRTGNFTFTVESEAEGGLYSCGANNGFGPIVHCGKTMVLTVTERINIVAIRATIGAIFFLASLSALICVNLPNRKLG